MKQYYDIAGLSVEMDSFGYTVTQAESYLTQPCENPDIIISSDWRELKERQPHLSEEDCEYMSTGASFYYQLLNFDGMLLHASAAVVDGRAYLFSAPCGTGKSTHTALWRKTLGEDRVRILNDDKPALRLENGVWYAYGTPWSGKTDQNLNLKVPLAGICFLSQAQENHIQPFAGSKAVFALMEQTARPRGTQARIKMLELMDKLLSQIPVWRLECNMEPEAALLSYEAMSGGRKE